MSGEIVTIGNATLHHADCRDVLPTLGKFDLLLTDPPYGIGYAPTHRKWNGEESGWAKIYGDEKKFLPAQVLLSADRHLLWGANYYSDLLPLGGWVAWDKRCSDRGDAMLGNPCEFAWNSFGAQAIARIQHGGVINADSLTGNNENRFHPTQKPVKLMDFCLRLTPAAKTVLDPFMGSGTTGVACIQSGRAFTGIERERKYFDIVCERISRAQAQGMLFEPVVAKPEQQQLAVFA